ncbi:MAG TPA: chitobiase/beta-hexosaminidase C-terminal domain-containing protein, partial [Opitutaceae bacterium]|nr:chitobiase/beta-hexosaminidase C-terminal domain-containing protein [Opitutaceae bacterium]
MKKNLSPGSRVQCTCSLAKKLSLLIVLFGLGSAQAATINVTSSPYNASTGGTTDDTTAINNAISAANAAGGGIVEFPSGTYLSGSIKILSNVTLQLDSGATIKGNSGKINAAESENSSWSSYQDYGHDHFHDALIWADGASNIGITGPGTIDGNGALQTNTPSSGNGTKGVCLKQCDGVVLSDFTIKNGGWFGLFTQGTNNVVMTNVKIKDSNQRDAFDLVNGQHYDISDCDIEGSDDAMCLKSDYALGPTDASGKTWDNQDIHVDGSTILSTGNNAVQIGSETVFNFHDCTFSNLTITQAGKAGLGVTSNDGAVIDGITFSDITMTNCVAPIHVRLLCMGRAPGSPGVGKIKNLSFINITSSGQPTGAENSNPVTVFGYPTATIDNVVFNNVNTTAAGGDTTGSDSKNNYPEDIVGNPSPSTGYGWQPRYLTTLVNGSGTTTGEPPAYGFFLRHVNGVSFIGCQAHYSSTDDRAVLVCDNDGQNIKVDGLTAQVGSSAPYDLSFVATNGYQSTNNLNTSGGTLRVNTTSYSSNSPLPVNSSTSTSASITSPAVFTPYSGTYTSGQTVTLASATSGATIRYTTDGSTPTTSSGTVYSGAITLSADVTLKAIAYASGMNASAVNTAIYTVATSGGGGGGGTLTYEAENISYTGTGATASVQTDANASNGKWVQLASNATGQYIDFTLPSVPAGTYSLQMSYKSNNNRGQLSLSVDGTTLGSTVDQYQYPSVYPTATLGNVTFSSTGNHDVRLTVTGKNASSSGYGLSADAFILVPQSGGNPQAAAPSFSPGGGTYTSTQTVTITSSTGGASIRYTTDGSTPSETNGTIYSSPVSISATTTLKAIAYESGYTDSSVTSATYTISSGAQTYNFEAESLTYTPNGATASVQTDTNSSGGKWVELAGNSTGDYIDFSIPSVAAGTYQVQM